MSIMEAFYQGNKRRCPSCIELLYPGDCEIVSTIRTGQPPNDIPPGSTLKKAPAPGSLTQHRARLDPEPLVGPRYTLSQACRKCPICGYYLPYNIEHAQNLTIAIVGDNTSGKSLYISALIKQLEQGKLLRPDQYTTFKCLTRNIEERYENEYFKPLFEHKQILPPSQGFVETTHEPLIYELTVKPARDRLAKSVNIVLYDTSGEDYMVRERLVEYARYVLSAEAIIFLADPVTMPEIYDYLPKHIDYQTAPGRSASAGLTTIIDLFARYQGKHTGSTLRATPIAITLSKADLLKYLMHVSQQYSFMQPHIYKGGIDLQDINQVDREVRHLIQQYGDNTLLQVAQAFARAKFFATSATGYPPDDQGIFPAIVPHRCLDPLLWVLHELKIIPPEYTY